MIWQFWAIVLGSLAAVVGMIVGGFLLPGTLGQLLVFAGILCAIAWLGCAIYVVNEIVTGR